MRKLIFGIGLSLTLILTACSTPAEPTMTETEAPVGETVTEIVPPTKTLVEPTLAPTDTPSEESYPPPATSVAAESGYPAPTVPPPADPGYPPPAESLPAPVTVTFPSTDGTQLAGTFYPPLSPNAPVVVLMHQYGSDQQQWDAIVYWLQTGYAPVGNAWLPQLPQDLTFAVFTFDFRGHGASEGDASLDAELLMDAQSAVAFAKTQAGVDPLRVLTIGTSIGADGAVDACITLNGTQIAETQATQGCLGAMSISPGSFIGVNYTEAATTLLSDPYQAVVYCVAAEGDGPSPEACNSVNGGRYVTNIYPGDAHGIALFGSETGPMLSKAIYQFLLDSLQLRQ